jgi:hypothetical protein
LTVFRRFSRSSIPRRGIGYKKTGGYDHTPYMTSIDIIEALTGLDFPSHLPEEVQAEIERVIQIRIWE